MEGRTDKDWALGKVIFRSFSIPRKILTYERLIVVNSRENKPTFKFSNISVQVNDLQ